MDRVRAVGALPKELPTCIICQSTAHCPGFALWRSGPSPCRGRTARRAVSVLPMRAHCPGLLLAVDRVRASGRTARRANCICLVRAHCPGSFVYLKRNRPFDDDDLDQRNLATSPGYSTLEALQTLGNRPWRLSVMMLAKTIPANPKDF